MDKSILGQYKRVRRRNILFMLILVVMLVVTIVVSACMGGKAVGWKEIETFMHGNGTPTTCQILLHLRLPRIVAAIICGWGLAVSGCIMQILLRNPLASPYTLGLSNAAAFGASVAIVFGGTASVISGAPDMAFVNNPYLVTICAFISSLVALAIILLIAKAKNGHPQTIILAGVILSSLFGAALSGMQYIATSSQLASIVFWSFGDLGHSDWMKLLFNLLVILPATVFLYYSRWNYKAVSAGDEYARSLGVNPNRTRIVGMSVATLCTAIVVSFFGVIAFIGLVVPHMVRRCIGQNEEFLLPASAIFGAAFLLVCDTLARTIISPILLPVGIITSLIGAPLFLALLLKHRRHESID